jgi:hypothetical protein
LLESPIASTQLLTIAELTASRATRAELHPTRRIRSAATSTSTLIMPTPAQLH